MLSNIISDNLFYLLAFDFEFRFYLMWDFIKSSISITLLLFIISTFFVFIKTILLNNFFIISWKKNELKKGKLEDTSYDETLLDKNIILKFFFLYNKESIELEEPEFIILQYIKNGVRSDVIAYTNKDNINDFYEKLFELASKLSDFLKIWYPKKVSIKWWNT